MTSTDDACETAILEVKIGGQWVEWKRIDKKPGEVWNGLYLDALAPETRVYIVREDKP